MEIALEDDRKNIGRQEVTFENGSWTLEGTADNGEGVEGRSEHWEGL